MSTFPDMKKKSCILLAAMLAFCVTHSQDFEEKPVVLKDEKPSTAKPKAVRPMASVTFQANHDFYLTVDDESYGKRTKSNNNPIRLPKGKYTVIFEEADSTGERKREIFVVDAQTLAQKNTTYIVSFKKSLQEVLADFTGKPAEPVSVKKTAVNESREAQVAKELSAQMVPIPGDNFLQQNGGQKEGVSAAARISDFNLSKYEITQQQWQAVMGYNHSAQKNCNTCPVENVSYVQVQSFIEKLNKAGAQKFRLPTVAEWEYLASKVSDKEVGMATNDPAELEAYKNKWREFLKRTAWLAEAGKATQVVGSKEPTLGLYDLFGNVAEWCVSDEGATLTGGAKSAASNYVAKGGSFKEKTDGFSYKSRTYETPETTRANLGFRLVADAR